MSFRNIGIRTCCSTHFGIIYNLVFFTELFYAEGELESTLKKVKTATFPDAITVNYLLPLALNIGSRMNKFFNCHDHVSILRTATVAALLILIPTMFVGREASFSGSANAGETNADPGESIVLLSVTSDAKQSPQSVDMAMKFAGLSLDEGRKVVMFFQVQGVTCPTKDFPNDFAFQENNPIKLQLQMLIERGVDVHVCPICMKSLDVQAEDLIVGAKVTTRPSLFENIGATTAVFTY